MLKSKAQTMAGVDLSMSSLTPGAMVPDPVSNP